MEFTEKKMALVFKALSDENRIRILKLLHGGERCACKLLEELNIRQPKEIYNGTQQEMLDKGILKKVFHVDIQHSDYRIELKSPAAVSSEAIIIGFGNSSCRSR